MSERWQRVLSGGPIDDVERVLKLAYRRGDWDIAARIADERGLGVAWRVGFAGKELLQRGLAFERGSAWDHAFEVALAEVKAVLDGVGASGQQQPSAVFDLARAAQLLIVHIAPAVRYAGTAWEIMPWPRSRDDDEALVELIARRLWEVLGGSPDAAAELLLAELSRAIPSST